MFRAVAQNARGLGAQVEQGANRSPGTAAGAKFQHLSQEHERDDGGGGFEVDRRRATHITERCRKHSGEYRGSHTKKVGHPRTHGDQREHVG